MSTVLRSLLVYAVVVVVHVLLRPIGPVRLAIDAALYVALAVIVGALRPREMLSTLREALRRKSEGT
jgi:CBS domain containing-hemolysin-like protein